LFFVKSKHDKPLYVAIQVWEVKWEIKYVVTRIVFSQ